LPRAASNVSATLYIAAFTKASKTDKEADTDITQTAINRNVYAADMSDAQNQGNIHTNISLFVVLSS
jgi:hypothetical protein